MVYDDFGAGTHEVDGVDGLLMALSPWTLETLQLKSRGSPPFHGYDAELCVAVRAFGGKVVVTELPVVHRCSTETDWTAFERARDAHFLRWREGTTGQRMRWRSYVGKLWLREKIGR